MLKKFKATDKAITCQQDSSILIMVAASTPMERIKLVDQILTALNSEYYLKMAMMKDNDWNYDAGFITKNERDEKEQNILNSKP